MSFNCNYLTELTATSFDTSFGVEFGENYRTCEKFGTKFL